MRAVLNFCSLEYLHRLKEAFMLEKKIELRKIIRNTENVMTKHTSASTSCNQAHPVLLTFSLTTKKVSLPCSLKPLLFLMPRTFCYIMIQVRRISSFLTLSPVLMRLILSSDNFCFNLYHVLFSP